jgi:membrane associated rhomboid family serine protease
LEGARVIPLRDENLARTVPVVTRALILINLVVFFYEATLGPDLRAFLFDWGFVPVRLTLAIKYGDVPLLPAALPVFTSMFLHGGWSHLIGNLWYLWIFGDNVEDVLGHATFLLFYLVCGVVATMLQYLTGPLTEIPTVGASGAIAAVLGAYIMAFPRARVFTLLPIVPFFQVVALPAFLILGLWFLFQFVLGLGALGASGAGGIAFWAHVGGFTAGLLVMRVALLSRRSRAREI